MVKQNQAGTGPAPSEARRALRLVWSDCVRTMSTRDGAGEALSQERLFEALDGRELVVGGEPWRVEVYSICEDDSALWLQVGLDGVCRYTLLLRLTRQDTPRHALNILRSWLVDPAYNKDPNIRNVA